LSWQWGKVQSPRHTGGKAGLKYKTHRAVDALHEVITATEVTPGIIDEAHKMTPLIDSILQIALQNQIQ